MVVEDHSYSGWPPIGSPLNLPRDEQHWSDFDSSVNAVSFGFVATAILISMFLIMAIFERFLRPTSPPPPPPPPRRTAGGDLESQQMGKLGFPSPKMSVYSSGVSVLMPGDEIPTFIAHPAPAPCCPERVSWPSHEHKTSPCSTSNTLSSINQV
ncbi:putative transmembrane protein [Senna tora]|uniref:Putative transmembrane protein n=1 Tax=Senna tora TaxID=362788 RepID=A0A834SJ66_9FABA|nr:putative transmembrane protein [Senna tora]